MNGSEKNKELIQRIAETLRNHAEPYKEGAWERFSAAQGIVRKRVIWPYWSAAAVLLVAAVLFLVNSTSDSPTPTIANLDTKKEQPITSAPAEPLASTEKEQTTVTRLLEKTEASPQRVSRPKQRSTAVDETHMEPLVVAQAAVPTGDIFKEHVDEENIERYKPSIATETESEAPGSPEHRVVAVEQPVVPKMPVEHFSKRQEYAAIDEGVHVGAGRKWDLGVAVAPSMTSEKLNLSGGIAVAYQLSDKFSVGSGVSIGRLGMGENPNYQQSSGEPPVYSLEPVGGEYVQGLANKREQYKRDITLTSSVVALDIPLDLRYEVFNGFYTSVGVSYVAVLSEQRTEHFIGGLNETTLSDKVAGKDLIESTTVGYVSEKMDVQPLKGKGYAGFMNFSVGRKVSVSKHLFFSIEPYFKLPIGQLSKEQMDFTNGGIRIVTGF
ncbi:outer membrane beta-barrel protein [Parapedobacter indicus]|uniref:Outer membrane protein beta-barrel domain-containing protein n=1 Tax=Parapedobacter indicus TaxID=1477437 RepID=A0A1I3RSC6_9SPHI|nr:outer membrane beta-barrel protein [Parapedobacter indicus]PPL00005.1 hypothetical protein CLV26_110133 [Parapedobacter indicus]SFJ49218.1 hypothetical protein SAMN05444682_110113 [Parapedobacter indicus]